MINIIKKKRKRDAKLNYNSRTQNLDITQETGTEKSWNNAKTEGYDQKMKHGLSSKI